MPALQEGNGSKELYRRKVYEACNSWESLHIEIHKQDIAVKMWIRSDGFILVIIK